MVDRSPWRRTPDDWEPFMAGLRRRVRAERRKRVAVRSAAAGSVVLLAWLLLTAPGEIGRRGSSAAAPLLMARIPSGEAPRFEPESGLVAEAAGWVVVVREGGIP